MLYINTFLDTVGEFIRGEKPIEDVEEFLNQDTIFEMFKRDCKEVVELYRSGQAQFEEVKKNLNLLKAYVVSQLFVHFERLKELAESKGVKVDAHLEEERINEIALYIDKVEREL